MYSHVNLCGKLYVIIISREHQFIMEWILLHLLFIFWICTFDRTERKSKMKNILRIHYETNQLCSQSYIYEYVEKTMQMKNY